MSIISDILNDENIIGLECCISNPIQQIIEQPIIIQSNVGVETIVDGTGSVVTGITPGSSIITCAAFVNQKIAIWRGNIGPIPININPGDGSYWATKVLNQTSISLSSPLALNEFLRIQTIS